ncbi:hypothetical protein ACFRAO_32465 [Streptomyces sp. NPDC056656]|uniref:hypothetical protein n=1 Tax=Streptomyces sp. NPDC056656 TaxID=3345895 RepID=UPI00367B9494
MDLGHVTIFGFIDALPIPGSLPGTAQFTLLHSPTEEAEWEQPDTAFTCTTHSPEVTEELLTIIRMGDLVQVTGTLAPPGASDTLASVLVDAMEVLVPAPLGSCFDLILERYGPYVFAFDAGCDAVPVWTESGAWVGLADTSAHIIGLIDAWEQH